ncbi:TSUP family transporter [Chengkuizengella axinellae]|uniref:Probable membrane transporter protein n=1 Tax=Chengkuizengella axinellae TaxID=3064388 RepID=A0ABT9J568_9BACL|nr:TSUP family transporter [Chengkuizengella sp. 2205SS18-9]MDP5276756.1 TSUP family transporter [Chengkuizengella sp. 2205SS18-9]
MEFGIEIILLLFIVAIIAGWVDTIAGGGGLITIPSMILAGLPPSTALATNKLQGSSGTFISTMFFLKKGAIDLKSMRLSILMTFLGSILGGWLLLQMNADNLQMILPFMLVFIGIYFLFSPNIDNKDRPMRMKLSLFSFLIAPLLGFYDGFFGPGTGSLIAMAFIALCGYSSSKATANAKLLNFTSNFSALIYFIFFGHIAWIIGLVMMLGQIIGSFIGAKMVLDKGASIIKPVVITVCFIMAIQVFWRNFG